MIGTGAIAIATPDRWPAARPEDDKWDKGASQEACVQWSAEQHLRHVRETVLCPRIGEAGPDDRSAPFEQG
jgi:hypothetical protein